RIICGIEEGGKSRYQHHDGAGARYRQTVRGGGYRKKKQRKRTAGIGNEHDAPTIAAIHVDARGETEDNDGNVGDELEGADGVVGAGELDRQEEEPHEGERIAEAGGDLSYPEQEQIAPSQKIALVQAGDR